MKRGNLNDIFIGVNQSGKTTVAEKMVRAWRSAKPSYYSLVAHDPTLRIEDITNFSIDPEDEEWGLRVKRMRNIYLWLDEFRLLNEKNTAPKGLKNILQMKDHWNIDVVSIFHNPELVLNCFTFHKPRYFIFQNLLLLIYQELFLLLIELYYMYYFYRLPFQITQF